MSDKEENNTCRVLVIGDLHFCDRSAEIIPKLVQQLTNEVEKEKPDFVVFLGDTLDRFDTAKTKWLCEATHFIIAISKIVPVLFLIGNHDIPNKTHFFSKTHGFPAFEYIPNITIADGSVVCFESKGFKFLGVPYCPNGRFQEALDTYKGDKKEISAIFCHQEFIGCEIKGIVSKKGDRWLDKDTTVIMGHFHGYQRPQTNIYCVGSPYQDAVDEDPNKSISLFTFTSTKVKERRIFLSLPKKVKLRLSPKEFSKLELEENNIYTVVITGKESVIAKYHDEEKIEAVKKTGGKVITKKEKTPEEKEELEFFAKVVTVEELVTAKIKGNTALEKIHSKIHR